MTNQQRPSFIPENSLEQSLVEASTNPGARPAFYREFLESDIFVPGFTDNVGNGPTVVAAGDSVSLAHWSDEKGAYVPVFSSLRRLSEAITQEQNYLQMNARALLEIVQGEIPVALNPGAPYGKIFTTEEMRRLLDGSLFQGTQRHIVEKEQQVMLGQPSVYPQKLVDGLKVLFAQHREVESAYLAHIFAPDAGEPPHTIVGIKMPGDMASVTADAGMVAREVLAGKEIVDFVQIGTDDVSRYMLQSTEPFYVRE